MGKVVIIAEKPSAMRNMAKALGGTSGVFAGENFELVCARGHLYELLKPHEQVDAGLAEYYNIWSLQNLPWNPDDFAWKFTKQKDVASVLSAIKTACKDAAECVCATDVDPSGEGFTIFTEIVDNLPIRCKKFSRMYFMDESVKSIQKAFRERKEIPDIHRHDEYMKATYRSSWDFLSMQWTRIAKLSGNGRDLLRQGRLKSAMVLLIGDQLKLVSAYKKIPYYENRFKDENGIVYSNPEEPRFPDRSQVPRVYHSSQIVCDGREMKLTVPPKFMDLASLSAKLAPKGYKPKQVLSEYQRLYEAQIVSYPRTEDKTITPEQFNDMLPLVDRIASVVGVDSSVLTHRSPRSTHVKPQGAHGANRPGPNVPDSLDSLRTKYSRLAADIYEVLARSYLASLAEDFQYESQKGHVKDYPKFTGVANVPKFIGWKSVFQADIEDEEEMGKGLGRTAEPFIYEGFPPKPAVPTIKWLKTKLEKYNIGTGATRTSTLAEISEEDQPSKPKRQLVKEDRGKLTLAECGEMSYRLLPGTYIGSLDVTKQVEDEMKAVAAGSMQPRAGFSKLTDMVVHDIRVMQENGEKMRSELGISMQNGFSGSGSGQKYPEKEKAAGIWKGKQVSFNRVWGGHRFTDAEVDTLLAGGEIRFSAVSAKTGKPYTAKGKLANLTYNGTKYVGFKAEFV